MPRILAIDYGSKRTGLAVTDELQLIASGLSTFDTSTLMDYLARYFATETVSTVLIGEPKQMNGQPSQIAPLIEAFVTQ